MLLKLAGKTLNALLYTAALRAGAYAAVGVHLQHMIERLMKQSCGAEC